MGFVIFFLDRTDSEKQAFGDWTWFGTSFTSMSLTPSLLPSLLLAVGELLHTQCVCVCATNTSPHTHTHTHTHISSHWHPKHVCCVCGWHLLAILKFKQLCCNNVYFLFCCIVPNSAGSLRTTNIKFILKQHVCALYTPRPSRH